MRILFFDTETTGITKFNLPIDSPEQPRMVQLGCLMTNEEGRPLHSFCSLVCPNNYDIPVEVSNIHGITTHLAKEYGIDLFQILQLFDDMLFQADLIVGWNIKFDIPIIAAEMKRCSSAWDRDVQQYCAMLASTEICQIPKRGGGFKWPKLSEAYRFFFNEDFKDAHDAMNDVMATKRIFFEGLKAHNNLKYKAKEYNEEFMVPMSANPS